MAGSVLDGSFPLEGILCTIADLVEAHTWWWCSVAAALTGANADQVAVDGAGDAVVNLEVQFWAAKERSVRPIPASFCSLSSSYMVYSVKASDKAQRPSTLRVGRGAEGRPEGRVQTYRRTRKRLRYHGQLLTRPCF